MSNKNNLLEKDKNKQEDLEKESIVIEDKETKEKETLKLENTKDDLIISTKEKIEEDGFVVVEKKNSDVMSIFSLLVVLFISISLFVFCIFTVYNVFNPNIVSGVFIKGIDVSGLSTSDARYQLDQYVKSQLPEEILVKYDDFEATISLSQMDISFDTKAASHLAFQVGRTGNIFENNLSILSTFFGNINIEPNVTFNKDLLTKNLEDLSSQLPNSVEQSSYYIEENQLIITPGKEGYVVDVEKTMEAIKNSISSFSCKDTPVTLVLALQKPDEIDVEKIHNEIYKDPVDAYYTKEPFEVHPSENGMDFNISIEDVKTMIASNEMEEYVVPLKIIYPNITTNMIGTEAFPDLLSTFSTKYAASNRNRTTNLILASNKINGTVLMPGETFSYNKVVGARTIAARL